ncbi:MAG: SMC-Scp complex subunit ScpB [Cytophagales bacterium]
MDILGKHIEAIIFCTEKPVSVDDIRMCMADMFEAEVSSESVQNEIEKLIEKYNSDEYSFGVFSIAGGYQFLTKPAYQTSLSIFLKNTVKKRISASALETLSIIAYKQPITKSQIEQIRGVNCDYAIQKLLEKDIVEIKGKADTVGKPVLYGTNQKFLEYFGINTLKDLPLPKDFVNTENEIGTDLPISDEISE